MIRLNKACELKDFSDEELLSTMRGALGPKEKMGEFWPQGLEDRKFWEIAMVVLSMQRHLPMNKRRYALGVGAGTEATNFILTNYFQWVIATDVYGQGWDRDAPQTMLIDPGRHSGTIPWRPGRLLVQYMDGRRLRFEDESFDLVYSCSSIEHFGDSEDIIQGIREMARVVRRGGVIAISTELEIRGRGERLNPSTMLLSAEQINKWIIDPSGCRPVDEPDYQVASHALAAIHFDDALRELPKIKHRLQDRWSRYPHIMIERAPLVWSSAQITLLKP
jgi:SAM-dependent methyltransferase